MVCSSLIALALGACVQTSPRPDYRALGTEPFWSVTIGERTVKLERLGMPTIEEPLLRVRHAKVHTEYPTRSFVVIVRPMECSDGMSDRRYADRVTVRVAAPSRRPRDAQVLNGCGRAYPDAASLDGTRWRFASIDGEAIAARGAPWVAFTQDQLSGSTGCNQFRGDYAFEGGRLRAGRLATTRRGCGEQAARERSVLSLLGEQVVAYPMGDGGIRLVGAEGRRADLVPVPVD